MNNSVNDGSGRIAGGDERSMLLTGYASSNPRAPVYVAHTHHHPPPLHAARHTESETMQMSRQADYHHPDYEPIAFAPSFGGSYQAGHVKHQGARVIGGAPNTIHSPHPTMAPINTISKPKRPLSSFNLFYRFKRRKLLEFIATGRATGKTVDKAEIERIVTAAPGLEDPHAFSGIAGSAEETRERQIMIRNELADNLLPRDNRDRQHRTNESAMNGTMSFVELGKVMNASWKNCDEVAKQVFDDLADEGRHHYQARLREYLDAIGENYPARLKAATGSEAKKPKASAPKRKAKSLGGGEGEGEMMNRSNGSSGESPYPLVLHGGGGVAHHPQQQQLVPVIPPPLKDGGGRGPATYPSAPPPPPHQGGGGPHSHQEMMMMSQRSRLQPFFAPPGHTAGGNGAFAPVVAGANIDSRTVSVDHSISSTSAEFEDGHSSSHSRGTHHPMMMHHRQNVGGGHHQLSHPRRLPTHHEQQQHHHPYHHHHNQHHPLQHPQEQTSGRGVGGVSGGNRSESPHELHARVRDLEGQLQLQQLRSKVFELENEVSRRKDSERQLLARIHDLSSHGGVGSSSNGSSPPLLMPPSSFGPSSSQQQQKGGGGLDVLFSASMIHQQTRPLPPLQQNMNSTVTSMIHQPSMAQEEQCMVENNDEQQQQQQENNSAGCKRTSPCAKSQRKKQKLDD